MINLYTDGACSPNPGLGGWAASFDYNNKTYNVYGYEEHTTNNRMEMISVIEGLKTILFITNEKDVTVYSDSQYVVSTMTWGWKKNKNIDLWSDIDSLCKELNITWIWVKGHASNLRNNLCDELAVNARVHKVKQNYYS